MYAGRGMFDWWFDYKIARLLPENEHNPSKAFENPVMAGGFFAISAKLFWKLGGYDRGLIIYGKYIASNLLLHMISAPVKW